MSKKKVIPKAKEVASNNGKGGEGDVIHTVELDGLYQNWFLDYASYVILERAVPSFEMAACFSSSL